jgi:signal transduction histidine kinase
MALLDSQGHILYDSHTKHLLRPLFFPFQTNVHPEVEEALREGRGYAEEYSEILKQKLIYMAKVFEFQGKSYVLRVAFPFRYTQELKEKFQFGFILFSSSLLILFSVMAVIVLHRLTKPIHTIIDAIKPYQEGKSQNIPKIELKTDSQDDFSQLASTLNSLSEQISGQIQVLEMRREFVANASHELKTPITIIRGFAEMLQDAYSLPRDTVIQITNKIISSSERMAKTISNLLTLANIDNLPLARIAPCDLVELVRACKEATRIEFELVCAPDVDYTIIADEALLEVALTNLIDNAAKYSKEDPKISVTLQKVAQEVKIAVKDNGIGIPENDLERIFQRFYRVNSINSKKTGGSGLGLSIVETIVKKHYGKIYAESTLGEGSTFTIVLKGAL